MVTTDADFTVVRGDDIQQPFTVTLDAGRALDGTESWRFQMRALKSDASTLVALTSPTGVAIDGGDFQPSVVFTPATLTVALFPPTDKNKKYWYDLEMTKDTLVETIAEGKVTVISDVSR